MAVLAGCCFWVCFGVFLEETKLIFLLKQRDHIPGSKNSRQARGFLSSARIGERSFAKELKQHLETSLKVPAGTKTRADLPAAAAMCPSQAGKSGYKSHGLDWQDRQAADCVAGSKVFEGIVTLWQNFGNEAATKTYVPETKIQKELRPDGVQQESAPWLSEQPHQGLPVRPKVQSPL